MATKRTQHPQALYSRLLALVVVLFVAFPGFNSPAHGIVIRHDRSDLLYQVEDLQFPYIFYLHTRFEHKVCMATLISTRWAITAAHCLDETPIRQQLEAGQPYALTIKGAPGTITAIAIHPEYMPGELLQGVDLALIQLDHELQTPPVRLNQSHDEQNTVVALYGWGYSGVGTQGRSFNDGRLRRAYNRISNTNKRIELVFDDPRTTASLSLDLEGIPALGDSGGPALLETPSGQILMGIAVGEIVHGEQDDIQGSYGAIEIYERISLHLDWIESITGSLEPGK